MILMRWHSLLVLAAAGAGVVRAQDANPGRCEGEADPVDTAAAWGAGGQLPAADGNAADSYQWLYVVNPQGESMVYLLSKPGVALPDASSPSDYCAISFELPLNNLLLAQTDDGSCGQTFGADCVQSMKDAAVAGLTSVGGPSNQNEFCIDVADAVAKAFQTSPSCRARNPSGSAIDTAGYYTPKDSFCDNSTSSTLFPRYRVSALGGFVNYSKPVKQYYSSTYDRSYRTVWPQMAITLSSNAGALVMPKAYMGCPRVTNKTANATVPAALPAGNVTGTSSAGNATSVPPAGSTTSAAPAGSTTGTKGSGTVGQPAAGGSLLGALFMSMLIYLLL